MARALLDIGSVSKGKMASPLYTGEYIYTEFITYAESPIICNNSMDTLPRIRT